MEEQGIQWQGHLVLDIYQKGIDGGFRDSIVELTGEAYQTFLKGFSRSPIILSGEALQRLNCEFILQYIKASGETKRLKKNFELQGNQISGDFKAAHLLMKNLTLFDTIVFLEKQELIEQESVQDMNALRILRNLAVHSTRVPRFDPHSTEKEFNVREIASFYLRNGNLPLQFRKHKLVIPGSSPETDYIIDQVRLGIEIEKVHREQRGAIVALSLLFTAMSFISQKLPFGYK